MIIELIRGDTSDVYKFQRTNAEGAITTKAQKMWITFKKTTEVKEALFQRTLENGITFSEVDYYYRFRLESEDTCNLSIGSYGFDIKIINEAGETKTLLNNGVLRLVTNYTHKENEV